MTMVVLVPRNLQEALEMKAARPEAMIDVSRLPELHALDREDGWMLLGAGVTYARITRELCDPGPWIRPLVRWGRADPAPRHVGGSSRGWAWASSR